MDELTPYRPVAGGLAAAADEMTRHGRKSGAPATADTVPAVYEAEVDEMTAGGLAVLGELRRRLVDARTAPSVLRVVDAYAGELVLAATEDQDEAG